MWMCTTMYISIYLCNDCIYVSITDGAYEYVFTETFKCLLCTDVSLYQHICECMGMLCILN